MKYAIFSIFVLILFLGSAIPALAADCNKGQIRECGSNVGICVEGYRVCQNEEWGECLGKTDPMTEVWNNKLDDDCDGIVDEFVIEIPHIIVLAGLLLLSGVGIVTKMGFR